MATASGQAPEIVLYASSSMIPQSVYDPTDFLIPEEVLALIADVETCRNRVIHLVLVMGGLLIALALNFPPVL